MAGGATYLHLRWKISYYTFYSHKLPCKSLWLNRGLCRLQRLCHSNPCSFPRQRLARALAKCGYFSQMGKEQTSASWPGPTTLLPIPASWFSWTRSFKGVAPNPSPPGMLSSRVSPVKPTSFSSTQSSSAIFAGSLTVCHLWNVIALTFRCGWGASVNCRRLQKDVHLIGKDRMIDTGLVFCQSSSVSLRGEAVLLNATRPQCVCVYICHVGAFQPTVKGS